MERSDYSKDRLTLAEIARNLKDLIGNVSPQKATCDEDVTGSEHVAWLLDQVDKNHSDWAMGKLGRWVGIAMGCLACHGHKISSIKDIVRKAKISYGEGVDLDLDSHLNDDDPFYLDIGGSE